MSWLSRLMGSSKSMTGSANLFEVFGRGTAPSEAVAHQVIDAWVDRNPRVTTDSPSGVRVRVNVDESGLWTDSNVRAHYPLAHYNAQKFTWETITVGSQDYWLLVVFD